MRHDDHLGYRTPVRVGAPGGTSGRRSVVDGCVATQPGIAGHCANGSGPPKRIPSGVTGLHARRRPGIAICGLKIRSRFPKPGIDVLGSPYAVYKYEVDSRFGGDGALRDLRRRLRELDIRLILD